MSRKGDSNELARPDINPSEKTGEPCGSTLESPKRGDAERRVKVQPALLLFVHLELIMGLLDPATVFRSEDAYSMLGGWEGRGDGEERPRHCSLLHFGSRTAV